MQEANTEEINDASEGTKSRFEGKSGWRNSMANETGNASGLHPQAMTWVCSGASFPGSLP